MADDVTVDNGDLPNYKVAADETAHGHVQLIKLAYGVDGDTTFIGADANGLDVDIQRLPGSLFGATTVVTVTTTPTLLASQPANRKTIKIRPIGGDIYYGYSNTITTANGWLIKDGEIEEDDKYRGAVYAVVASGTVPVRIREVQ